MSNFNIIKKHNSKLYRRGVVNTAHGSFETPAFMPVGTKATVKSLTNSDIIASNSQIILANTYHLMLRPGEDLIYEMGGLHKFMNIDLPILTDSGGFQVMSLSKLSKINDQGVIFNSHIDGKKYFLTPKYSIDIQNKLDADISMIFDECPSFDKDKSYIKESLYRSISWAKLSKESYKERDGYHLFGIIQGGIYEDLRKISIDELIDIDFDGYAIGGLAVGEGFDNMVKILKYSSKLLPYDKPKYLMGVGKPIDIVAAVLEGVDMFDCVLPTRCARNGRAFVRGGEINILNSRYKNDPLPLDESCSCYTCQNYSRSYLHHLFKNKEMLGPILMTRHNLHYYQDLMRDIRESIEEDYFDIFAENFLINYNCSKNDRI